MKLILSCSSRISNKNYKVESLALRNLIITNRTMFRGIIIIERKAQAKFRKKNNKILILIDHCREVINLAKESLITRNTLVFTNKFILNLVKCFQKGMPSKSQD